MIKLLGAAVIMIGGALMGCVPLAKLADRMRLLSELIRGLEQMRSELCTNAPTIPQLMRRLGGCGDFFGYMNGQIEEAGAMAFYDAWHDYINRETLLNDGERDALHSLGDTLGRYVMEEQLTAIDRTLPILKEGYSAAKVHLKGVSRLYIGTALSLSAMLVIVLL